METTRARLAFLLFLILLAGCTRAPVYLMPTPEVIRDPRFDTFARNPNLETLDEIRTFYATSRAPADSGDPKVFSKERGEELVFGEATFRIGDDGDAWRAIYDESATVKERDQVPLKLIDTKSEASLPLNDVTPDLDEDTQAFFNRLNAEIDASDTKILTVFAHGANNSFYESVARGAQLKYFTGQNDIAITFAWPSAGSIWGYGHDTREAVKAGVDFANFLKLLALHSSAEFINVIGYSAGGRVTGGALKVLGADFPPDHPGWKDRKVRRLNQVYLAASDEPLTDFLTHLPSYEHLVETITLTVNPDDNVLALASIAGGQVRVGGGGGAAYIEKMAPEDIDQLRDLMGNGKLDVIDMQIKEIEGFEYSHEFWYANPWVSSDVLVTLYARMGPEKRGLKSYTSENEFHVWYFPSDYVATLKDSLIEMFEPEAAGVE